MDYNFISLLKVQREARKFEEGIVHEMCYVQGYGFLDFKPIINQHIVKFNVYQVLS
jgi:hypothetical protein